MRILLVDDDSDLLDQAKIFLEKVDESFEVSTTTSPRKALDEHDLHGYDAIISDYKMPDMDGIEFLRELREKRGDDLPFIIFTGKGREEVAMEALNLGADRYLQKGGDPKSQYGVLAQAVCQEVKHHRTKKRVETISRDLEETFETISNPIFLLDDEHKILRTNEAAEEFFGEEVDRLLGEYCYRVAHDRDEAIENCPLERSLKTKEMEELEFYHEGLDRYFIARTNPIMDEEGNIKKVVHQEIDITEIKKKEKELEESKILFDSLFNDPDTYIGILALDGTLIKANQNALKFIGRSMEELKDEYFWETPWWDHSEELQERLKEAIERAKGGEGVRFETVHHGKDGEKVKVDFSLRPVKDDRGKIDKLMAYGRNINHLSK